jgi:hypothetical protein
MRIFQFASPTPHEGHASAWPFSFQWNQRWDESGVGSELVGAVVAAKVSWQTAADSAKTS